MRQIIVIAALSLTATALTATAVAADQEPPATQAKPGWTETEMKAFLFGCTEAVVRPAKRDYYAAAEKNNDANPKPFPETELRDSVGPMCACLGQRVAETWSVEELAKLGLDSYMPYIQEAFTGGRCAPGGMLGAILEKARAEQEASQPNGPQSAPK
jgi:hypothetical protein